MPAGRAGLRGRAVCGRWLPACLLLGSHGVFSTALAQKENLSSERAGGSCRTGGQAGFPGRSHERREYVQSQHGCSQRDCLRDRKSVV